MDILVETIDCESKTVHLAVRGPISPSQYNKVRRFVNLCQKHGYADVRIEYSNMLSDSTLDTLRNLSAESALSIATIPRKTRQRARIANGSRRRGDLDKSGERSKPIEHLIRLTDFDSALDRINPLAIILGSSEQLDEKCLSQLEFCLHELVANTIEHASFAIPDPDILITLNIEAESLKVIFADNGEPFEPENRLDIDISARIKDGHKRGFGLFLLRRITEDLKHERYSNRNRVTFRLTRNLQPQED